jgi:hypothetical protein
MEWRETKPGSVGGGCSACVLRCQNSCKAAVGWLWRSHFCKAFPLVAPLSLSPPSSLLAPPLPLTPLSLRRWIQDLTAVISSDRGLGIELGKPSGPVEASGALLPVRFLPGSRSAVRSLIGAPC